MIVGCWLLALSFGNFCFLLRFVSWSLPESSSSGMVISHFGRFITSRSSSIFTGSTGVPKIEANPSMERRNTFRNCFFTVSRQVRASREQTRDARGQQFKGCVLKTPDCAGLIELAEAGERKLAGRARAGEAKYHPVGKGGGKRWRPGKTRTEQEPRAGQRHAAASAQQTRSPRGRDKPEVESPAIWPSCRVHFTPQRIGNQLESDWLTAECQVLRAVSKRELHKYYKQHTSRLLGF